MEHIERATAFKDAVAQMHESLSHFQGIGITEADIAKARENMNQAVIDSEGNNHLNGFMKQFNGIFNAISQNVGG